MEQLNQTAMCFPAMDLLQGAYDLHTHTEPSHFPRALDDFQLLREAGAFGMAGVMLKSHYEPTGARARVANLYSGSTAKAYGGIVLNHPAGGLNPYAAESALKMGASIVWMPTRDAQNCLLYGNMQGDFFRREGITVLDAEGRLKPEIYEIMDVVKQYGACLATGHLSAKESIVLCTTGAARGVRMILTHPEWYRTTVPIQVQQELAAQGVWIEKNWYNVADHSVTAQELAAHIKALKPGTVFLATDRGQYGCAHPALELLRALESMLNCGVSEEQMKTAVQDTPEELVSH